MNPVSYWLMTRWNKLRLVVSTAVWYLDYQTDRQLGNTWEEGDDYYSGRRLRARCSFLESVSLPRLVWDKIVDVWSAPAREFDWRGIPPE